VELNTGCLQVAYGLLVESSDLHLPGSVDTFCYYNPNANSPLFPIATQTEEVDRETTADYFIVSLSVCRIRVSGDGL